MKKEILFWNPIWVKESKRIWHGNDEHDVGKLNKKEQGITSTGNVGKVSEQPNNQKILKSDISSETNKSRFI